MNTARLRRVSTAAIATVLLAAGAAHAEIVLYDKDGWAVKTDGLAQGFYMLSAGDTNPTGTGEIVNFDFLATSPGTADNSFVASRFRSGWTGGRFNWRISRQISETVKASAFLGIAYSISTYNAPAATNNNWDIRNGFVEIEAPWGDLAIGRSVGLYTLGAIISTINDTSAALGLGNTCGVPGDGLGCYTTGYGAKFPAFWAGFFYTTPDLHGLKIKVAALDPVKVGANQMSMSGVPVSQEWARTPLPQFQTLAMYEANLGGLKLKPYFNGFWQRVGKAGTDENIDPMGGGAGVDVAVGGLRAGAGGTLERGSTMYVPLVGNEIVDGDGQLRTGHSFYIHGLYSIGSVDVNAGYGMAHLDRSSFDEKNKLNINRSQRNIYMGVQYHIAPLTFVAELNLLHHEWYLGNTQNVTVFSLGADFAY
jgi:predicted porin